MKQILFFFYLTSIQNSLQLSTKVAVIEYTPAESLEANYENYRRILEGIKEYNLGLVIFPEGTLNHGGSPNEVFSKATEANEGDWPCYTETYPKFMRTLSCGAQAINSSLVINAVTKNPCDSQITENCKEFNHSLYNSNIVFDDNGTILYIYHKYNLFDEDEVYDVPELKELEFTLRHLTVGKEPIIESFSLFTSFDILCHKPAHSVLKKRTLTHPTDNFIFPHQIHGELPFLTALQIQQMYAMEHNVQLFSSGAHIPRLGSTGSAFYRGKNGPIIPETVSEMSGQVISIYSYSHTSTSTDIQQGLAVEEIDSKGKAMDAFVFKQDPSVSEFASKILTESKTELNLCHEDFCCKFNIEVSITETEETSYTYHLVAYSGTRKFSKKKYIGIEVCSIVACLNSSVTSCGLRFSDYEKISWTTRFEKIEISGDFNSTGNNMTEIFPNSLLGSITPVHPRSTEWTLNVPRTFKLVEPQERLLVFGIYGREFERDFEMSSSQRGAFCSMLLTLFLLKLLL